MDCHRGTEDTENFCVSAPLWQIFVRFNPRRCLILISTSSTRHLYDDDLTTYYGFPQKPECLRLRVELQMPKPQ